MQKLKTPPMRWRRVPVAAVLGHVDHGKTTLLDRVRRTSVAQGEPGRITQRVGAFVVNVGPGEQMTFLDTPGHAAFRGMRERGARATDIAVLAVALDDGVMPQTRESIAVVQAQRVPLVVAMTKADVARGRGDAIARQLLACGVHVESLGGDTQAVEVSSVTGEGVDTLLACLSAQAAVLDLETELQCPGEAIVVEAGMRTGLGATATVVVRRGVLRVGTWLVGDGAACRVRALLDDCGRHVPEVVPGMPAVVCGFRSLPAIGSTVTVHQDAREAKAHVDGGTREPSAQMGGYALLAEEDGTPCVRVLVRTDDAGSAEAAASMIGSLPQAPVRVEIVSCGPGAVTLLDASYAQDAHILTYGRTPPATHAGAPRYAHFDVIYRLEEHIQGLVAAAAESCETVVGTATVVQLFEAGQRATVLGCAVTAGELRLGGSAFYRVSRGERVVVAEAQMASLRQGAQGVSRVGEGAECGAMLAGSHGADVRPGDILQCIVRGSGQASAM